MRLLNVTKSFCPMSMYATSYVLDELNDNFVHFNVAAH